MFFRTGLATLFLFGVHSKLRLFSGEDVILPNAIAFIVGIIFILIHLPKFFKKEAYYLYALILFFICSIFFGPNSSLLIKEKFLGFIQIASSLLIGFAIFCEVKKYSLESIARYCIFIITLLLLGSIIEITTPFKYFLEFIMQPLYPLNAFYYSGEWNEMRDINYYLFLRPKFLTSEPSYLGQTISMLILFWRLSTKSKNNNTIFFLLISLSFLVVRSPMILFLVPIYFFINLFLEKSSFDERNIKNISLNIIFIIIISLFSYNIMFERIQDAMVGIDYSLLMRTIAPFYIAWNTLIEYPLLGVGIESKDAIGNIMLAKFLGLGLQNASTTYNLDQMLDQNHSYILKAFIYFGLLGVSVIVLLMKNLMVNLKVYNVTFVFLVFSILGFTHGNITGINTWAYFFIICAILSDNYKSQQINDNNY